MPHIRDQITEKLAPLYRGDSVPLDRIADELMVIVRDSIALGFDTAAGELNRPDMNLWSASEWLRQWADDARSDRRPVDLDRLPDTVEPLVVTILVGKDRPLDEDQIAAMAADAARRAVRTRQSTR